MLAAGPDGRDDLSKLVSCCLSDRLRDKSEACHTDEPHDPRASHLPLRSRPLAHREDSVPLVCLETAQAVKFSGVIREALGREPEVPAGLANLERQPQRYTVLDADVVAVKDFIERNCQP